MNLQSVVCPFNRRKRQKEREKERECKETTQVPLIIMYEISGEHDIEREGELDVTQKCNRRVFVRTLRYNENKNYGFIIFRLILIINGLSVYKEKDLI